MTIAAIGLAIGMIELDRHLQFSGYKVLPWGVAVSPEGARMIFATVAGSMITVAGVVFSITIVALSLATTQFGPRLLRNFMRDRSNQVVLGTFVATFVYCLLLLRTTHGDGEGEVFVPESGLAVGMLLTLAGLGVFIYFVHHTADSIQAPTVAANVASELKGAIEKVFPEKMGHEKPEREGDVRVPEKLEREGCPIIANSTGYLQAIDAQGLVECACKHDVVVQVCVRPGEFVVAGDSIARIWPPRSNNDEANESIACCFIVGKHRTAEQDVAFPVQQLVDMALRALSPSLNDPHTAITCADHIGAGLCSLAERSIPSRYRFDQNDQLRVVADPNTFVDVSDLAFRPLREHGTSDTSFAEAIMGIYLQVARRVRRPEDAEAIQLHARETLAEIRSRLTQPRDRQRMTALYEKICEALPCESARPDAPRSMAVLAT